jgi:RNA polymerase sigma-70 factor (ECF subfamily)
VTIEESSTTVALVTTLELNSRSDQQKSSVEESLVWRAQAGDVDAFGELAKQYHRRMLVYIVAMTGERATAEEVAQEVFLAAFQTIDRFAGQSSFATWLMGIARNKAISALRSRIALRRRERAAGLQRLEQWKSERISTTSSEQCSDQIDALRHCLAELKPEHRELLQRHYRDNESAESIAQHTGRKGSAVRMLFLRLRKLLLECMQREQANDEREVERN